ncbi:hypothetical protein TrVE_jg4145 [Triparma verrucosa]|uniref:Molybdate-anion transporter n=2 Tax=Triparma TaxID=722752 RepID=A0A9W6ZZV2_9STRA|nr:hypothetical protein TrST_g5251 [Triparma strigata]GMH90439.1 hypothetical protein TrVE_jg4145 [Triparma verrucosa]
MESITGFCSSFVPAWPRWSVQLLVSMTVLLVSSSGVKLLTGSPEVTEKKTAKQKKASEALLGQFKAFKMQYLTVYLVIMLADWMQGTHMYTLYLSYGVDISALFLCGFMSGAIFAPFLGSAVDKIGRKKSCVIYCVLEIIINCMEHSTNFTVLLAGRVLGGISTNLLFSAFESWMNSEFRKRKFPEAWLTEIHSSASVVNGSMAILAGIVAQWLEDMMGHIGPFKGAVGLTAVALMLILQWPENYGERSEDDKESSDSDSLFSQFKLGWTTTLKNPDLLKIGIVQSFSEGAMYTFVFMWVPTLLKLAPNSDVPTGAVFSSLMIAITIGGNSYPIMQKFFKSSEMAASAIYLLGACSMLVPVLCLTMGGNCFYPVLVAFMLVEFSIGMFMPAAGICRSKVIPDNLQGAIMNIYRLPLNLLVVTGTKCTDLLDTTTVYSIVGAWFFIAAVVQFTMTDTWKSLFESKSKASASASTKAKGKITSTPPKSKAKPKATPRRSTRTPGRSSSRSRSTTRSKSKSRT